MKIGRVIERNVFVFLWLFFFISTLLVSFFHTFIFREEYWKEDAKFLYCWYAGKYMFWPHEFLFKQEMGTYLLGPVLDVVIIGAISLTSFIAADFLWRKIFWNKKKDIDNDSIKNLGKTTKMVVLQTVIGLVKWIGRLLTCLSIPFLMYFMDGFIYELNYEGGSQFYLVCVSVTIIGCIISWRFPLIGAIMMLAWIIPSGINEDQIFLGSIDLAAIAFFATWVLGKLSERIDKMSIRAGGGNSTFDLK
jgi:hypothetical protein